MTLVVQSGGIARRVSGSAYATIHESVVDLQRQLEDLRWVNLGTDDTRAGLEDDHQTRKALLKRIRVVRRKNPLAKQAANLLKHYTLGQGIGLKANNKALVAKIVDEFWENPTNNVTLTGHQALQEFLDTVFTDGEAFLALFPDTDEGVLELGLLDAIEVEDIIPDRQNRKVARWYKVAGRRRIYDFRSGTWTTEDQGGDFVYYRDWRNDSDKDAPPSSKMRDGLIYHVAINRRGLRGESELAAALDWIVAHRNFMEGRATLNKAAATFAWRRKQKTGPAAIKAEVERLRSTLTNAGTGYETNPPPANASTLVENDASDTSWLKTDTGGAAADYDERKLRMMAGQGAGGVPNHYFGDEAQANLATATAMELPLLKTYEDWQVLLRNVIADVIEFQLQTAHEAGRIGPRDDAGRYSARVTTPAQVITADNEIQREAFDNPGVGIGAGDIAQLSMVPKATPVSVGANVSDTTGAIDWYVDIDFPPIIEKDLGTYVTAIKAFYEMLPSANLESQKLVVEQVLNVLGINDVDQVMERLFPPDAAVTLTPPAAPSLNDALASLLQPPVANPSNGNGKPPAEAKVTEAGLDPLAEYRVRRLLRATTDARDSLARVGS